jgi:hypothetical protein
VNVSEPNDVINDRIDALSKGFLAMTVVCALPRSHVRSIPTSDYYALHGVFASIIEAEGKAADSPPEKSAA